MSNSGEGGEYSPKNLKYCKYAYYSPDNDTYICDSCIYGYNLNIETHLCYSINNKENIGSQTTPKTSSNNCYYERINCTLVKNENDDTYYIQNNGDLLGCIEAIENTTFISSKFNCTKCSKMYISIYDKFFDRIICQNIKGAIIKEKEISYEIFKNVEDKVISNNGTCENEYLFTPDGEYCYKCNDELVGMPGCKGGCSFSLERFKPLRCKGECETGYIESTEGICSPCTLVNKGCHECHYEAEYPIEYKGIKRKRRFVCDDCEEGFMQLSSG